MGLVVLPPWYAQTALLTGLLAYWQLEEASGLRLDSAGGGYSLSPQGSITSGTGKLGTGLLLNSGTGYAQGGTGAPWHLGGAAFTLAAWWQAADFVSYRAILAKDATTAGNREYTLTTDTGNSNKLLFQLFNAAGSVKQVYAAAAPTANTWYYVVAWYDPTAATINLQINNGAPTSTSTSGFTPTTSGTGTLTLNAFSGGVLGSNIGRLDEVGIWTRVLTADERTALYNGGTGLTYSNFT